ncbi:2-succinyl-6-hydroxy-2,4-cyclohexadiene-1-carboxylate synthase [Niallia nealsonii]|uniref:Putative 2-succinyl-6-hydroxy-2,4-cyclohexadiene-1-carboxylate synthase n=1 Tax=Niallia nealsonii TaxID=115979 RepID=A0A2N0YYA2_9BACI|nr:2-succinyl-6-hydroxy-2,4-cyclohexadiene-1-carboxylate synthase [Niallia nealsonii]PKG22232.1 2-succinyl-6-hydroxy-2,4-cyclohexadiene-1-carboxylate synthase [Niallia nealsonii]
MDIVVDDVAYHVEIYGQGDPLVVLHGFTGDSSTWYSFIPVWKKTYQLILIDIIGHGKTDSSIDVCKYNILTVANHIKKILVQLKVNAAHILGYSMGGRLALTFAIRYPDFVRKLILESASPGLKTEQERKERRIQDKKLGKSIVEEGVEKFVAKWENIPLFRSQQNLPTSIKDNIRKQRLQNNPLGLKLSLLGMGTGQQPSWWDNLHMLTKETLLITGELDTKFCLIAEQMKEYNHQIQWLKIKEAGHAIHVEKSEIFGTIVKEFLSNQTNRFDR